MKLRYLRVCNQSPLKDIKIDFSHEPILGRNCAIHFIAGVNGSGKSRLLQTIAEIFLSLDPNFGNQQVSIPDFPVTLAYDLGKEDSVRTVYLRHQEELRSEAIFIEFKRVLKREEITEWEKLPELLEENANSLDLAPELPLFQGLPNLSNIVEKKYYGNDMPGRGDMIRHLPKIVLAYTSGATSIWESIFTRINIDSEALTDVDKDSERPLGWNFYKEQELRKITDEQILNLEIESADLKEKSFSQIGILIKPDDLKLAFCAVALEQAINDFEKLSTKSETDKFIQDINQSVENHKRMSGLRGILNTVDWLWPITISLRINYQASKITKQQEEALRSLAKATTAIVRDPEPGTNRLFVFDLQQPSKISSSVNTAVALYEAITEVDKKDSTPFDFFRKLYTWKQEGLLIDVQISFRKRNLREILLYDWLSDGEQVFLGRMALFHLLKGKEDALLLLDEPETHFNDLWKREIIDIIDESLGQSTCNAVITTHSSIALTDVFDNEISLLKKSPMDSVIAKVKTPVRSFGASPNEIMRDIFDAPETVGQRAAKFLDLALVLASNPTESNILLNLADNSSFEKHAEYKQLYEGVKELPHDYGDEDQLKKSLLGILQSFRDYAKNSSSEESKLISALDVLEKKLGAGYYQLEFRRRLRALRKNYSAS
jgi:predicted ATPase